MEKSILGMSFHFEEENLFSFLPPPRLNVQKTQIERGLSILWVLAEGLQEMMLCLFRFSFDHQEQPDLILEIRIGRMNFNLPFNLG